MAERPNNDIEKQLRDYAAQRRDAAGTPQMHPATRQLLQTEVKRHHATSSRGASSRGWYVFWPRLAMALSVLAVIAVVMVVFEKQSRPAKEFELAKSELMPAPETTLPPSAESALAPKREAGNTSAGADRSDKSFAAADTDRDQAGREDLAKDIPSTTLAATAAPSAPTASKATAIASKGGFGGSGQPAGARSAAFSTDAESNRQLADASISDGNAIPAAASQQETVVSQASQAQQGQYAFNSSTQRFRNTDSQTQTRARGGAPQAVLDEFVVEQNGSELKIVDRDGSIYNGYVRPATDPEATSNLNYFATNNGGQNQSNFAYNAMPNQAGGAISATNSVAIEANSTAVVGAAMVQELGAAQNFVFAVEGTNRSLQQRVVFNGNLIQNTGNFSMQNVPVNSQNNQNYRRQEQSMPIQNAVNQQLRNNYINGRVYLGNSRSGTELNALSTDP